MEKQYFNSYEEAKNNNGNIKCECGVILSYKRIKSHQNSKNHANRLKENKSKTNSKDEELKINLIDTLVDKCMNDNISKKYISELKKAFKLELQEWNYYYDTYLKILENNFEPIPLPEIFINEGRTIHQRLQMVRNSDGNLVINEKYISGCFMIYNNLCINHPKINIRKNSNFEYICGKLLEEYINENVEDNNTFNLETFIDFHMNGKTQNEDEESFTFSIVAFSYEIDDDIMHIDEIISFYIFGYIDISENGEKNIRFDVGESNNKEINYNMCLNCSKNEALICDKCYGINYEEKLFLINNECVRTNFKKESDLFFSIIQSDTYSNIGEEPDIYDSDNEFFVGHCSL